MILLVASDIKYKAKSGDTEIDMVTNTEAIQIKKGGTFKVDNPQFERTLEYAKLNKLKLFLIYNPNEINATKLESFKKANPEYEVRAATDIPKNRHKVMIAFSSVIKFN